MEESKMALLTKQDKLGHVPTPPPLEPAGLPTGYYKHHAPKDVIMKYARRYCLGPLLMKPKRDHFVAMIRTFHVMDTRPTPCKFSFFKAQTDRYYREMEQLSNIQKEEEEIEIEDAAREFCSMRKRGYEGYEEEECISEKDLFFAKRKIENSKTCVAYMQGVSPEGHAVSIEVRDFRPYFFIKAVDNWSKSDLSKFAAGLEWKCSITPGSIQVEMVLRKELFGFFPDPENPKYPKKWRYIRVSFPNINAHRRASFIMKNPLKIRGLVQTEKVLKTEEVFRSENEHAQRIVDDLGLTPEGWIVIGRSAWRFVNHDLRVSSCPYEIITRMNSVKRFEENMVHPLLKSPNTIAPLLVDSWDIECIKGSDGDDLPSGRQPKDVCYIICHSFSWMGSLPPYWAERNPDAKTERVFLRVGHVLGKSDPVEGMIVEEVTSEANILQRMRDWMSVIMDVDVLTAFNGDRFDVPFVFEKANLYWPQEQKDDSGKIINPKFVTSRFFYISRLVRHRTVGHIKKLENSAMGENYLYVINPIGRHTFDTFQYIRTDATLKLDQYSLNAISKKLLNMSKHDVHFRDIFKAYKSTPRDIHKILAYCGQDCDLPILLLEKRMLFINVIEMARATLTSSNILLSSGQQVKVFNQLMRYAHNMGFVINRLYDETYAKKDKYGGGTVLQPIAGYYKKPVATLDFKSLYPSIMCAHNLCFSSFVQSHVYDYICKDHPEYFEKGLVIDTHHTEGGNHMFVDNNAGVIPSILVHLSNERTKAKKLMAQATDPVSRAVYNGRQLSLKISANSIYGFMGVEHGRLPCRPIAETVTKVGGDMIIHCKNRMEEWYPGTDVIYGDSVASWCPVYVKDCVKGVCMFIPIERIASRWVQRRDGKEWGFICYDEATWHNGHSASSTQYNKPLMVWSDKGWTNIIHVIRHAYDGIMYRIRTRRGVVDVTGDHSLLDHRGNIIKPSDVIVGSTMLMHKTIKQMRVKTTSTSVTPLPLAMNLDSPENWMEIASNPSAYGLGVCPDDKCSAEVVSVETFHYKGKVYDLTTKNHHFHAGVGDIIVHNTDSIMVIFPDNLCKTAIDSFRLGLEAEKRLTDEFKDPIEMEMEKIYLPYLLRKKKNYAGKIYTSENQIRKYMYGEVLDPSIKVYEPYIDIKGLKPARRDNCAIMRNLCKNIFEKLFEPGDIDAHLDACVTMVRDTLNKLLNYQVPVEDLIITGSFKSTYKQDIPPQAAVGRRFNYAIGDRVPYVMCDVPEMDRVTPGDLKRAAEAALKLESKKKMRVIDRLSGMVMSEVKKTKKSVSKNIVNAAYARHPDEITSGAYKPDIIYYVDKQLTNALQVTMGFTNKWNEVEKLLKQTITNAKLSKMGLHRITSFMGQHTVVDKKRNESSQLVIRDTYTRNKPEQEKNKRKSSPSTNGTVSAPKKKKSLPISAFFIKKE